MRLQSHPIRQFLRPNHVTGICLFTLSVLLAACGGGGGGGGGTTTGATAAAIGTVEKIGSVKVNGITFDCINATVTTDDGIVDSGEDRCVAAGRNELDDNMHVVVTGKINADGVTGSASSVIVKHRFKGPVGNINLIAQTFTVLGQTIQVDDATVFKIGSGAKTTGLIGLTSLSLTDRVRVNGISGAGGTFLATYVKTKVIDLDSNEVKGIVTLATPIDFQIGTLTVVLNGQLAPIVGACVEVKGTLSGNTLTLRSGAEGLKLDDDCNGDSLSGSITKAEVEGVISGFINDATPFKVGGQTVSVSPSTTYRPAGTSVADLVDGLKVETEGGVTNGVLLATKVKIKKNGVRIEALADSAVTGNSFTILGITVLTNGISVPSIGLGTGLRVEGFKSGAKEIKATRIELRSVGTSDVTLRGPLDTNAVEPGFTILGVRVTTIGGTQFEDTTRANFFANATANTIVKAKGMESPDNAISAREVELED